MQQRAPLPNSFPNLGYGVGLRSEHYPYILKNRPRVDWFEAVSENYMGVGGRVAGRPLETLLKIRKNYPIVLHGVSLSIGSCDPLNKSYLRKLKSLIHTIEPTMVSDHLCWTGVKGQNIHDLMPIPYTEEALKHVSRRVEQVQNFLGRPILIENVSSYIQFRHAEMTEWEFLSELVTLSGCGLLLDINNVYVNHRNHGFDPFEFIAGIPKEAVGQFHIAGHSSYRDYVIDTHDKPLSKEVWNLYDYAQQKIGCKNTLLEWDDHIPPFPVMYGELKKAFHRKEAREKFNVESPRSPKVASKNRHRPKRREEGPRRESIST